jgi:hypothetical protein
MGGGIAEDYFMMTLSYVGIMYLMLMNASGPEEEARHEEPKEMNGAGVEKRQTSVDFKQLQSLLDEITQVAPLPLAEFHFITKVY